MTIELDVGLILLFLSLNTNFSNSVDINLPFCDKQSLENVSSQNSHQSRVDARYLMLGAGALG